MNTEIVLVDDHRMFRQGVRAMLDRQEGMAVVGEAEDGRSAVKLVRELSPHVVVLDVTMQGMNGIEACRWMTRDAPHLKVIAVSMHGHPRLVQEMLRAGASGYLLKESAFAELVQAIRLAVERNQMYLSPEVSRPVIEGYLRPDQEGLAPSVDALTPREREVVQLIAEGSTSRQIAETLGVSTKTVEKHRFNVSRKLGTSSVADIVKFAVREGLTSLEH